MPRPLIIKVEDHKSQPNKKAIGSIDINLMRGIPRSNVYERYNFENEESSVPEINDAEQVNPPEEGGSRSIVRSLISRYESSTAKANLTKFKSKSMVDLQKPQISLATRTTQDDFLYNKNKYSNGEAEDQKFDFKKVFLKFETSSNAETKTSSTTQIKAHKASSHTDSDVSDIKQKAKMLLEIRSCYGYDISVWQSQVVELLHQILKLGSADADQNELKSENTSTHFYRVQKELKIENLDLTKANQRWDLTNQHESEDKTSDYFYGVENLPKTKDMGSSNNSQNWNFTCENKTEEKPSLLIYREEPTLQRAKSLDNGELGKRLKVRDIKNIFEAKLDTTTQLSRSISANASYFGIKTADEDSDRSNAGVYNQPSLSLKHFNGNSKNNELDSFGSDSEEELNFGRSEEIDRDVIEGNRIITQPILASSMKIQELKNLFEAEPDSYTRYHELPDNKTDNIQEIDDIDIDTLENSPVSPVSSESTETGDTHVVENRMLPPPKIVVLDNQEDETVDSRGSWQHIEEMDNQGKVNVDVESSKQQIEELTKDIEEYEHKIANLSEENEDESSYLNEVLVRLLIKLDDIKTYGDEVILTERRKAIQFVQCCITKLKEKIRGKE